MVSKATKDVTIRVTEQEKKLLEVIRNYKKGDEYKENILYQNDGLIPDGYVYDHQIEPFYISISNDKTLLACYDVAIKEIGKKKLFLNLSYYTPFITNIAFQKELKKEDIEYKFLKNNELKKGYVKKRVECLYISDIDNAIEDFKKYLKKNYLEKALKYIEEKEKIEDSPYISIIVKMYEIKHYVDLIETAIELENDREYYDEEDEDAGNIEMKFYEKFLELVKSQKCGFILNIHPIFMDLLVYIFGNQQDMIEEDIGGYTYSSIFDVEEIFDRFYIPNLSPKEKEKRGRAIKNIFENILKIEKDNEKIIKHFNYEMIKNGGRGSSYRANLLNTAITISKGGILNVEKRGSKIYKFKR